MIVLRSTLYLAVQRRHTGQLYGRRWIAVVFLPLKTAYVPMLLRRLGVVAICHAVDMLEHIDLVCSSTKALKTWRSGWISRCPAWLDSIRIGSSICQSSKTRGQVAPSNSPTVPLIAESRKEQLWPQFRAFCDGRVNLQFAK